MRTTMKSLMLLALFASVTCSAQVYYDYVTYTPSSFGPTEGEVQAYGIDRFFTHGADNEPLPTSCEHIYPNKGDNVAWGGARIIAGLLDMYKATGDDQFLSRLTELADLVFSCRLDIANASTGQSQIDTYRNSSFIPAWPSYSYTYPRFTENVSHVVHTAAFTYAVARFVRLVREKGLTAYATKASQYLGWLQESMEAFDSERDTNGVYFYPETSAGGAWKIWNNANSYTNATNVVLPMNMQTTIGLAFLELSAVPGLSSTKRTDYRHRAQALASYFKNKLESTANGGYRWRYWDWGTGGTCNVEDIADHVPELVQGQSVTCPSMSWEDVSHAAVDIEFAVAAVALDLRASEAINAPPVFTATDLRGFANTLIGRVKTPSGQPCGDVDCESGVNTANSPDVVFWMTLAQYDARVYIWLAGLLGSTPYQYVDPNTPKLDRYYQGYAAYLKMKYSPTLHPINRDTQTDVRVFVGDFGGNSATDLLQHIQGVGWRLLIADGNNFNVSYVGDAQFGDFQFTGDFNGDGRTDLLQYVGSAGWRVLAAHPATGPAEKHRLDTPAIWSTAGSGGAAGRHVIGDFKYAGTGPHYQDLAYHEGTAWRVLVSTGNSFDVEQWSVAGAGVGGTQRVADIYTANSFGSDLIYHTGSSWRSLLSWNYSGTWRFDDYTSVATAAGSEMHSADFTGDGRDDVLRYLSSGSSGSGWYLLSSQSYGFPGFQWTLADSLWSNAGAGVSGSSLIGHFNADTLSDLAYYLDIPGQRGWRVFLSNGTSLLAPSIWTPAGPGEAVRVGDFTGDGLSDLAQYVDDLGGWRVLRSTGTSFQDMMWNGALGL